MLPGAALCWGSAEVVSDAGRRGHIALTSRVSFSPSLIVTLRCYSCICSLMPEPRILWHSGPLGSPAVQTIVGPWAAGARGGSFKAWC